MDAEPAIVHPDHHDPVGVREGKRLEDQGVDDAEDGGGGADAEGDGRDGDGGESLRVAEGAEGEAHVLPEHVDESKTAHIASLLGVAGDVAEAAAGGPRCLVRHGTRSGTKVHRVELEVQLHLLAELASARAWAEERTEAIADRGEE